MKRHLYRLLLPALLCSVANAQTSPVIADTLYTHGNIITMNDKQPSADAVAVREGRIIAVGKAGSVMPFKGLQTVVVDLHGKTLLPGFVDGHSHLADVGLQASAANLLPRPDGAVNSIGELQKVLRAFMTTSTLVKNHHVLLGMNYDDSQLIEKRHPTRQELDAISTEIPIYVIHQSGHIAVANTLGLGNFGITGATQNPAGGVIVREADGMTPNGVLQENAFFNNLTRILPSLSQDEAYQQVEASQALYLSNGFTTIQDGKSSATTLQTLSGMAAAGRLKADVVSYADIAALGDAAILHGPLMSRSYHQHFRIGGVKLTFDGSPQGKTAWFTQPYFVVPDGENAEYAGYPAFTDADALKWFCLAYKNNWQVYTHANGDAAIDQLIRTERAAASLYPGDDRRPVLIHGQFIRKDQITPLRQQHIFPSLYPMHTYYWGDWHRQSVVGPERADNMSPTGWMLEDGILFSIHSDAPVTFPNSMRILDSAVNRTTRSGYVAGPHHRLDPLTALKAMTLWPAYQYFEENNKGSVEVGKEADFVILSENPLKINRAKLKDIQVLETIKDNQVVFERHSAGP